ncbi:MAG: hypothetical protein ACI9R3_006393 [Verrucomicrobiales bacterium]|jgi:hypothetical protein
MTKPEWPLFVFREDGVLDLCETLRDAQREYEGVDVEGEVYEFYDFSGCPARPVFTTPNKYSSFLGLFPERIADMPLTIKLLPTDCPLQRKCYPP